MKRLAIGLSIIVLLATFSPGFSILAQSTHTPHENPAATKSSPDPVALMSSYGKVFDLAAIRQYQDAQSLLKELEQANIPDEIRYIVDRYNTLSQQLFATLNKVESLLHEIATLFLEDKISEAKEKLDTTEAVIHDAQFLLEDIETATNTLADNLGVFAAPAASQLKQAYNRLEQSLQRLRQLIAELERLRQIVSDDPPAVISTSFYYPTFYYPTLLEVSAPKTAYPGLPTTISGRVSSTDIELERTIRVLLDNIQLTEENIQGKFSLEITPPPQTSTGEHSLTVVVNPQGRYSGATKKMGIDISRLPIQTDIQVPQVVIIPKPIQISGRVSHNLAPVQNARVSLTFGQSSATTETATDGSFTTSVDIPLDLSLVGPHQLTTTIEPAEPWYTPLQIKRQIFTVNPLNIGLMLVAFFSLGLLVYSRVRTRVPVPQEEKVILQPQVREPSAVTPPSRPKYEFTDIKGRILSAYTSGLEAVEKMTSISMAAHTTLREFLKTVTPRLSTAIKPFTELTTIAEVAFYSAHKLDKDIATRAEQLAATIKEELHSEAAYVYTDAYPKPSHHTGYSSMVLPVRRGLPN